MTTSHLITLIERLCDATQYFNKIRSLVVTLAPKVIAATFIVIGTGTIDP